MNMNSEVRISLIQMPVSESKEKNLEAAAFTTPAMFLTGAAGRSESTGKFTCST